MVERTHEWHDLDIAQETRSRVAWIGWRWLLPAWGRVLKLVATDPTARKALRAQISYPASLIGLQLGLSSITALLAGVWEVSTWSTRSAASMNDVDADERRLMMGRRGMA